MRKRNNPLKTNRKRRDQSSDDLVTLSQATVSSQASVYTNQSRPARNHILYSQNSSQQPDQYDDFQDIISEEIDTLFITPQEERKIQNILQFARKGKINPKNAFQIPVRVIDPQVTDSVNMRFWKFASQLLNASMHIYDKRVQNTFMDTHKMFDTLVRVQDKRNEPLSEQQLEQKNRKQRGQIIQIQISELGKAKNLSTFDDIGQLNCQQAQKINIKNKNNQFIADPMFNKRLQAFDSNTLKSLFLNVFQLNEQFQVQFFNKNIKNQQKLKNESKIQDQETYIQYKIQQKQKQQQQQGQQQYKYNSISSDILQTIQKQIRKPFGNGQGQVFRYMSNIRKQNAIQISKFSIEDFTNDIKGISIKQFQNNEDYLYQLPNQLSQNDQTASINTYNMDYPHSFNPSQGQQQHNSINNTNTKTNVKSISYSSNLHYNQFIDDNYDEAHTMLTPWELEFKGQKLMKKKNPRGLKTQTKPKKEKKSEQIIELNFLDGQILRRKDVFKVEKIKQTKKHAYKDKFLTINMNPYHQMHKKHHKNISSNRSINSNFLQPNKIQEKNQISQEQNNYQNNQFNNEQQHTPSIHNEQRMQIEQNSNNTDKISNFSQFFGFQQLQSRGQVFRSTTIKNIRQENVIDQDQVNQIQIQHQLASQSYFYIQPIRKIWRQALQINNLIYKSQNDED